MPSVAFGVVPLPTANALTTSAASLAVIEDFEKTLPKGIELRKVYNTADYVNASVSNTKVALADGIKLAYQDFLKNAV
jgi:multidrug efflux pump subunit AcrB